MTDKDLGIKVLKSFYNYSRGIFPFKTVYSFDQLVKTLEARKGGGPGYVESLGMSVRFAEMDDSKINSSMYSLAVMSSGKIPSKNSDFYNFMVNEATKINFVDAIAYTAVESAKDIAKGAQQIGDSVLLTGKLITYLLPVAVLWFGYMYLKKKTA